MISQNEQNLGSWQFEVLWPGRLLWEQSLLAIASPRSKR